MLMLLDVHGDLFDDVISVIDLKFIVVFIVVWTTEFCWLRPTPKYIPRKFGFLLLSELEDEEALTLK